VGRDLRASSPRIASAVRSAVATSGLQAINAGVLPTPALFLAASASGHAAIMVTGSHIPADRNGLKFFTPGGEITKTDEARITAALGRPLPILPDTAQTAPNDYSAAYLGRITGAYGLDALSGLRIGVFLHSSAAHAILPRAMAALGADVVPLGKQRSFLALDTEAIDPSTRTRIAQWCNMHQLDALVSTDGDGDRPLLADENGVLVPGDVLGALAARALGAEVICTPVSSNSMIEKLGCFSRVHRTRIGSPFVIKAMEAALAADPESRVAGFEANGGLVLGFTAPGGSGPVAPLMTRDSLLPLVAALAWANARKQGLRQVISALPPVFTAADRLTGVDPTAADAFVARLSQSPTLRARAFPDMGEEQEVDLTDGLRVRFMSGQVIHLRPSGNAPELRCYAEAANAQCAQETVARTLTVLEPLKSGNNPL